MQFQDLVGANARDGEELQDAFRYFLTQLLQAWMRSGLVKFGDVSAMASPMPGMSVSVPAAIIQSSGCESAPRLSAALKYAFER